MRVFATCAAFTPHAEASKYILRPAYNMLHQDMKGPFEQAAEKLNELMKNCTKIVTGEKIPLDKKQSDAICSETANKQRSISALMVAMAKMK